MKFLVGYTGTKESKAALALARDFAKIHGAKIVVMEPFLLPCPPDRLAWREDLDPKIDAARRLAREFADVYVPLDGLFAAAALSTGPEYWAGDGVHPSIAGAQLMAQTWLDIVAGA